MFKTAVDVAEGKILFKETFSMYGALTVFLQAAAIKIFGEYLITIKLLTAFFYGLTSVFLWLIWSKFLPKFLSTFTSIVWILLAPYFLWLFLPWSSVYALFFQVVSIYLAILFIERNNKLFLFSSGALACLSFFCRQPVGILLFISLIGFFLILSIIKKDSFVDVLLNILNLFLGFFITLAFFIIWFLLNGSLNDWFLQTFSLPFYFGNGVGNGYSMLKILNCLFPLQMSIVWSIMPVVCILIALLMFIKVIRRTALEKNEIIILLLIFTSLASWAQYYPVPCIRHCYWSATPMFGLVTYLILKIVQYLKGSDNQKIIITALLLFLLFCSNITERIINAYFMLTYPNVKTITEPKVLYGIKTGPNTAKEFAVYTHIINDYLKLHPNKKLISVCDGPYSIDPLYLTLTNNSENFHPMFLNWSWVNKYVYTDYYEKLISYVNKNKPLILSLKSTIVLENGQSINDYYVLHKLNNGLFIMAPIQEK